MACVNGIRLVVMSWLMVVNEVFLALWAGLSFALDEPLVRAYLL